MRIVTRTCTITRHSSHTSYTSYTSPTAGVAAGGSDAHRDGTARLVADHWRRCGRPAPLLQRVHDELRQSGHDRGDDHCWPLELRRRKSEDLLSGTQAQQVRHPDRTFYHEHPEGNLDARYRRTHRLCHRILAKCNERGHQCSVLAHEPAACRARLRRPARGGRWLRLVTAPQPAAPLIEAEGPPSGLAVSWTPPGRRAWLR